MHKAKVIFIGEQAIESQEPIILFFGEGVTDGLREYSVIQKIEDPVSIELVVGDSIIFGEQEYKVAHLGEFANKNLQSIEHASFIFSDENPHEKLTSSVYLTPSVMPKISLGMTITYQG
ncbi:MAG TPA: PTS glucitol/sorbitol transporter subunit IIA [Candidatus Enterococcus avicola]|uniref:PTS glucitol/sorbitol transporter subunit IIA n=1 Tax=Candidatus Enterococcus avicola TaxID=2838561 RepID=A0A9D2F6Y3_9ENTE|nr:PTS glucitol/sorbitol transporter subunit IIA [Candidatus Enterococcus avicola]